MGKPTPGPYRVDGDFVRTLDHKERSRIKREEGREIPVQIICKTAEVFMSRGEREANARLLAASWELLEACKEFVRKVDCGEARSVKSYAQMKAAIAKAEGAEG